MMTRIFPTYPSQFLACKALRANYNKRMPAKTTCALVAMLLCFSAKAADEKPNAQQLKLPPQVRGCWDFTAANVMAREAPLVTKC